MNHLNGTPNSALQHLSFFAIEKAIRLPAQSFRADNPDTRGDASRIFHFLRMSHSDLDEKRGSSCQRLRVPISASLPTNDPGRIADFAVQKSAVRGGTFPKQESRIHVLCVVMEVQRVRHLDGTRCLATHGLTSVIDQVVNQHVPTEYQAALGTLDLLRM
jgi:hypothetical protein